ncbi:hypothetical protein HDU67_007958 [Dinochytrium kinnereticum]|nr:hypothetical protein HDU67_007958 [Dinochytrium kinnereticum]
MPLMHTIALLAQRLFTAEQPFHSSDALTDSLVALINKVSLSILNISLPPREPIEYYNIHASDALTICVFVMRKGATMPTHDHPGMTVFSKIVSGALHVKTYEFCSDDDDYLKLSSSPTSSASSTSTFSSTLNNDSCQGRPSRVSIDGVITDDSPDSLLIIRPGGGPNMHSFTAVSDHVVLLDIIGPPYNDVDRLCTYYKEVPLPPELEPEKLESFIGGSEVGSGTRMVVKKRKDRASPPSSLFRLSSSVGSIFDAHSAVDRSLSLPVSPSIMPPFSLSTNALYRQTSSATVSPPTPVSSKRSPPVFIPDLVASHPFTPFQKISNTVSCEDHTGVNGRFSDLTTHRSNDPMAMDDDEFQSPCSYRLSPPRIAWLVVDTEADHDCSEVPYEGALVHAGDLERASTARDIELLTFVERVLLLMARMEAAVGVTSAAGAGLREANRNGGRRIAVNG